MVGVSPGGLGCRTYENGTTLTRGEIAMMGFGWQSRVVNNYFDGQDLVVQLRDPEYCAQTVAGNLFLTEARVIL